jgi:hypothetical protein
MEFPSFTVTSAVLGTANKWLTKNFTTTNARKARSKPAVVGFAPTLLPASQSAAAELVFYPRVQDWPFAGRSNEQLRCRAAELSSALGSLTPFNRPDKKNANSI